MTKNITCTHCYPVPIQLKNFSLDTNLTECMYGDPTMNLSCQFTIYNTTLVVDERKTFFKEEPRTFVATIRNSFLIGPTTFANFVSVAPLNGAFDYKRTKPGMLVHPAWIRFSGLFDSVITDFFNTEGESSSCILRL